MNIFELRVWKLCGHQPFTMKKKLKLDYNFLKGFKIRLICRCDIKNETENAIVNKRPNLNHCITCCTKPSFTIYYIIDISYYKNV